MHDVALIRYLLFAVALMDLSRRRPVVKYLIYGLGAGALWGALNTLFAYLLGFDFLGRDVGRYALKLKEASRISAFSAYASTFFLSWRLFDKKINRNQKTIIAGIAFVALSLLLQTHIRTSILAAGGGMIFMMGYMGRKRSGLPVVVLNVFLACAATLLFLFAGTFFFTAASPDAHMDMHRLFSHKPNLHSLYARFEIWKVAWAMWLDNPVFGVGISSFQDAYREMASIVFSAPNGPSPMPGDIMEQTHAHNLFLMLASATGILGVGAFAWLFANAARLIFKHKDGHRVGLAAWPVVIFVMGLTGFNIYHSWYQALLAYLIVLIGCHEKGGEEQIVWQEKARQNQGPNQAVQSNG